MSTGIGPYVTPTPVDANASGTVLETTLLASHQMVDIGGTMVHTTTFNGAIPAPTLRLNVNDTVIVRFINEFHHPTSIHWHGIELCNSADGTEITQDGAAPMFPMPPMAPAPAGGTYLYKFKVPRPGLYWYHPHSHHAINQVFGGMYGMIVVADPNEAALIAAGVLPTAANTQQLVLSDITVCKAPGTNDTATYIDPTTLPMADRAEWLSGATSQPAPTPVMLCEIPPAGSATKDDGTPAATSYGAATVPSMVRMDRANEGQTVLTNGMNVGGRLGTPFAPGALAPGAYKLNVQSGQGLRLQIANCATTRYFRLLLTTSTGVQIPLVRIGGEGGLLDNAVVEGGIIAGFDTKYSSGEILLPAGSRADVVAAIPSGTTGVLTLWTRDYQRNGMAFSALPTVPVMHLNITGAAATPYTITAGTPLRSSIPGSAVETLGIATGTLLDPSLFTPSKPGMANQEIQITNPPSIDGVVGMFDGTPYTTIAHIDSSRYAEANQTLELTVKNQSSGHHPFHLHGFSIQPISLTQPGSPTFTWTYHEFRDNIDIPNGYTLLFRVRLDDRPLKDGVTLGGALGRWLFHCHIFIHHHQGMISELVVTENDGSEKPNVDVNGSWAYAPSAGVATRTGTYHHPDGDMMMLTASYGTITPTTGTGGTWSWQSPMGATDQTTYVYITATDASGRSDQTVFRLKIGGPDDGSDNGDPHIHTVDGKRYDFQAVGEFTLLRDREGMEIQVRQTPVLTANPVTDVYTGLTACVSINTAVAMRVGTHQISYQPSGKKGQLQFFIDKKPAHLSTQGIDLDGHLVSGFETATSMALRIDYLHYAVVIVTPHFWPNNNVWYLDISVSHTQAEEGLMGIIHNDTWLPLLPFGASVGPMPQSLTERYLTLYGTFANAWRVNDQSSLFTYEPGTSTSTFTDKDWPSVAPPCNLKPQFKLSGTHLLKGMPIEKAEHVCRSITDNTLYQDCVFDVATTGDAFFADGYRITQNIKERSTAVQLVEIEKGTITAIVTHVINKKLTPKGNIVFFVNNKKASPRLLLSEKGYVHWKIPRYKAICKIKASFFPADDINANPSSSPTISLYHKKGQINNSSQYRSHDDKKPKNIWVLLMAGSGILMVFAFLKNVYKQTRK